MQSSSDNNHSLTDLSTVTSYSAGILQAQAYRTLRRLADESLKTAGLTSMQWFIVGAVYDRGPTGITTSALSALLGTNMPFVTNSVSELIARDMLQKSHSSADARARLITVHPNFASQVTAIEEKVRASLRHSIYARVTPHELAQYLTILKKLNTSVE